MTNSGTASEKNQQFVSTFLFHSMIKTEIENIMDRIKIDILPGGMYGRKMAEKRCVL